MRNYQLQLPISAQVKEVAEQKAKNIGIDNINDLVRFLLVNFCENRVKIRINDTLHESQNRDSQFSSNIYTPSQIAYQYDSLSYGSSGNCHFIYEASNFDCVRDIIPAVVEWNSTINFYFKFSQPSTSTFVMISDRSLLTRISSDISGRELTCGIDPDKKIVYVRVSDDTNASVNLLIMESSRLIFNSKLAKPAEHLLLNEYLAQFFREYNKEFVKDHKINISPKSIKRLKMIDIEEFGQFQPVQKLQDLYVDTGVTIYAQIFNTYGREKFIKFIKHYLKYSNQSFVDIYRDFFKKEFNLSWVIFE